MAATKTARTVSASAAPVSALIHPYVKKGTDTTKVFAQFADTTRDNDYHPLKVFPGQAAKLLAAIDVFGDRLPAFVGHFIEGVEYTDHDLFTYHTFVPKRKTESRNRILVIRENASQAADTWGVLWISEGDAPKLLNAIKAHGLDAVKATLAYVRDYTPTKAAQSPAPTPKASVKAERADTHTKKTTNKAKPVASAPDHAATYADMVTSYNAACADLESKRDTMGTAEFNALQVGLVTAYQTIAEYHAKHLA
jgi:hypothetical protein